MMFQVFQLSALVIRGPATRGEKFIVSLDRVAIREEKVRGVLLCVQDFVRSLHFTQRNFFPESGFTMLSESVAIADSITSSPVYAPWSFVETDCAGQVVTNSAKFFLSDTINLSLKNPQSSFFVNAAKKFSQKF